MTKNMSATRRAGLTWTLVLNQWGVAIIANIVTGELGRGWIRYPNESIPIYNYVSGSNTFTFQENTDELIKIIHEVPSAQAIWIPWAIPFRSVFWYRVFAIFVHVIPGALLDIAFAIKGNPPMSDGTVGDSDPLSGIQEVVGRLLPFKKLNKCNHR
ncbi:unnamed protein product [Timema podura]|uniref:Uncharacterized protein n=1 Tax=Timema podura TaxID=61482 RepID=A0ABN7NPJ5_TIMPD|nr:unnamed protein product [Timema podura]